MAAATRTQIYLRSDQRDRLDAIGEREGKALAELVRAAVDAYLAADAPSPTEALDATFGALPAVAAPPRDEWERG